MENFLYCYLSPALVGLVSLIAIFVGGLAGALALIWLSERIGDWFRYSIPVYTKAGKTAHKVVKGISRTFQFIVLTIVGICVAVTITYGAWVLGIDILKRFVCK